MDIKDLLSKFKAKPPATDAAITGAEGELGHALPPDYAEFLKQHDGGAGFIGESYCNLWSVSELADADRDCEIQEWTPGLFAFGSDGGGEAFGYDLRTDQAKVVRVPFIPMEWQEARPMGQSFQAFLETLFSGSWLKGSTE